jgi:hypothetical protein
MMRVRTREGTEEQLRTWLSTADIEAWEAPQPVPGQPGRWTVRYVTEALAEARWEPAPAARPSVPPTRRHWSTRRRVVVAGLVLLVLVALVVAGYLAVMWVAGHLALVLGATLIAVVVAVLILRSLGGGGDGCTVIHIRR